MTEPGGCPGADRHFLGRNAAKRPWDVSDLSPDERIGELFTGVSVLLGEFSEVKVREDYIGNIDDTNDVFKMLTTDLERLVQLSLGSRHQVQLFVQAPLLAHQWRARDGALVNAVSLEPSETPLNVNYAAWHAVYYHPEEDRLFERADDSQLFIGEVNESDGLVASVTQLIKAGRLGLGARV